MSEMPVRAPWPKSFPPWVQGLAIVLLCLAVRLWLIPHIGVIARDGTQYIRMAREWSSDPSGVVQRYPYHVGYPAMVSWMHRLVGSDDPAGWELAGQAVSLLANLAATLAIWRLGVMLFTPGIGFAGAALFGMARNWAISGVEVLSDSSAVCLELWAIVCAVAALRLLEEGRLSALLAGAGAGILAGGAYLVRVEGLVAVLVSAALWLRYAWSRRKGLALGAAGAAVGAAMLCAAPYMMAIGGLTRKKHLSDFVPASMLEASTDPIGHYAGWREFLNKFTEALSPILLAMLILWIVAWVGWRVLKLRLHSREIVYPRRGARFAVGMAWLVLVPAVLAQYQAVRIMSHRYLLLLAALAAPMAAAGACIGADVIAALCRRRGGHWARAIVVLVALALLAGQMAATLRPVRADKLPYRAVAEYLAQFASPSQRVLCDEPWSVYYSGRPGETFEPEGMNRDGLLATMLRSRVDYIVLNSRAIAAAKPDFAGVLEAPAVVALNAPPDRGPLQVFRVNQSMVPSGGGCIGGRGYVLAQLRQGRTDRRGVLAEALRSEQCQSAVRPLAWAAMLRTGLLGQSPEEALQSARSDVASGASVQALAQRAIDAPRSLAKSCATTEQFVSLLYANLLGRQGSPREVQSWVEQASKKRMTRARLVEDFLRSPEFSVRVLPPVGLHLLACGEMPPVERIRQWVAASVGGATVEAVIGDMTQAPEFRERFGDVLGLDDAQCVDWVYEHILGQGKTAGGVSG